MAALVEDSIPAFGEGRTSSPEAMSSQTVEITPANGISSLVVVSIRLTDV